MRNCTLVLRRLEEVAHVSGGHRQLWDARFDELDKWSRELNGRRQSRAARQRN